MQTRDPYTLNATSYRYVQDQTQYGNGFMFRPKILGEGTFAVTYLGTYKGKPAAIKKSKGVIDSFQNELAICKKIDKARKKNPNDQDAYNCLVKLFGYHSFYENSVEKMLLVFEFLDLGDLDHWKHNMQFTWPMRHSALKDVASGLACLHKLNPPIIHGDIKPANILLYEDAQKNKRAKIIDFGLSKEQDKSKDDSGSKLYADPQHLYGNIARTTKLDIWAFGLVLYELFEKKDPYEDYPIGNDVTRLFDCIVTQMKTCVITLPDADIIAAMKTETVNIVKMLEETYDADVESDVESSSDADNADDLQTDDAMQIDDDQLKEIKRNMKKAPLQAQKASFILNWCCQFNRPQRPTAVELVAELSTAPDVISGNLQKLVKNKYRR